MRKKLVSVFSALTLSGIYLSTKMVVLAQSAILGADVQGSNSPTSDAVTTPSTTTAATTSQFSSNGLLLICGLIFIVLLIGLMLFVISRRRKD